MTATPSTDLVDGQAVQVTGSGFTASQIVQVLQCTSDLDRCRILTNTSSTANGTISTAVTVAAILVPDPPGDVTPIDCRVYPYCVIWAVETTAANKNNFDDIHFLGELPPPGADAPPGTNAPGATGPAGLTCQGQPVTILGTEEGNDELTGTAGRDVIAGLGGADEVNGLAGNDLICGGDGKDTLRGGKDQDKLFGQAGKDELRGGGGKDRCVGGKKDDSARKCEVEKSI